MDTKSIQNAKTEKQGNLGCGDIVEDFIEDVWKVMTPEMISHLKCILTEEFGMTKKDADQFIACQREIKRKRACLKKDRRVVRIGPRNQWIKELSKDIADQLSLFIVGILLSDRNARTKRITERVLNHLCELTGENTTLESAKTRVQRTMVVVADRMATWIDEAITDIERKMKDRLTPASSVEILSTVSLESTETETETTVTDFSDHGSLREKRTIKGKFITFEERSSDELVKKKEDVSEEEEQIIKGGEEMEEQESENEEETDEEKLSEKSDESLAEGSAVEEIEEESTEDDVIEEIESELESEEAEEVEEESTEHEESEDEALGVKSEASLETIPTKPEDDRGTVLESVKEEKFIVDLLDLLKEDLARVPKDEDKTERQKAMKKIIDGRFEEIIREKLDKSIDSIIKYDINDAASTVANWIEKILASTDILPKSPSKLPIIIKQGSAFEIKQGDGSQYKVSKLSSFTVAQKVAEVRGLDQPFRKKKIPRTFSPMNMKSAQDWADWALGAAKVGEEWGNWLDRTLSEAEKQLSADRKLSTKAERYEEWRNWKNKRGIEAMKWRLEKQKIKDEGILWNKKLQSQSSQNIEKETRTFSY